MAYELIPLIVLVVLVVGSLVCRSLKCFDDTPKVTRAMEALPGGYIFFNPLIMQCFNCSFRGTPETNIDNNVKAFAVVCPQCGKLIGFSRSNNFPAV